MLEKEMYYLKDYQYNDKVRISLSALALKTFEISFEKWYIDGYWTNKYIPYSIIKDQMVIANVSVNIMDFNDHGIIKHYIQLGTVMCDEKYRNKGLTRYLIEKVMSEYQDIDGMYLFANDSVLDFYPKFGFLKSDEVQYFKDVLNTNKCKTMNIDMHLKENVDNFIEAIKKATINSSFEVDNIGLILFYVTSYMCDSVYYIKALSAYVIAEIMGDTLIIHQVFTDSNIDLDEIIKHFGEAIKHVVLNFTPLNTKGWNFKEKIVEDETLFIYGLDLESFAVEYKMFPILSHA